MKKILASVLAILMIISMAACGGNSAPAATQAPAATEAPAAEAPAAEAPADAGQKTVGIAMPTKSLERWNRDGEYLKAQFEAAGYAVELTSTRN